MSKKKLKREIRRAILGVMRNNGHKTYRPKELARLLGYHKPNDYKLFRAGLQDLVAKKSINKLRGNRYGLKPSRNSDTQTAEPLQGTLHVSREGYGFVAIEDRENDVFIPRSRLNGAMNGDVVRIQMSDERRRDGKTSGYVEAIIDRKRSTLIGTVKRKKGTHYIIPDDPRFSQKVYLPGVPNQHYPEGEKLIVSLGEYDPFWNAFKAEVVEVLGKGDDPQVLMKALIHHHDISVSFSEAVEREAAAASDKIPKKEAAERLDLRNHRIFTIDPDDAKDFDDAIHVTPLDDNRFEVGVHIADVSYFVQPGSAIDREALKRATSVYLVDRVIPMLPERLSNGLCSLRPGEDKMAFSCLMEVDAKAKVHSFRFFESIIHSQQRFTYNEAQALIDDPAATHPMAEDVRRAAMLARAFTKKRFSSGSVEFDVPEVRVKLDASGTPVAIVRKELKEANRLIEEYMLLANQCAARALDVPGKTTPPFVYRVHDRPDAERIQQLAQYIRAFGLQLHLEDGNTSSIRLNALLQQAKGLPSEPIIKMAALRAMSKAVYAPENIGHYGLGFSHYTHFTSPIRRYPDLIVHRLLKAGLLGKPQPPTDDLKALCEHCSKKEKQAEEAERESVRQKQVLYALQHLGDEFDGIITSATNFGLFVELQGIWLEGLVHVRDLQHDFFEYDEKSYALVGQQSGKTFRPGDSVRVQLARANPDSREIDLILLDGPDLKVKKKKAKGRRREGKR